MASAIRLMNRSILRIIWKKLSSLKLLFVVRSRGKLFSRIKSTRSLPSTKTNTQIDLQGGIGKQGLLSPCRMEQYIQENGKMKSGKVKEYKYGQMALDMKENG